MRSATRLPAESSTIGTGDALDQLETDHRVVEALFAQASLVSGPDRQRAIRGIVHALTTHAELEETVVYPMLAEAITGGAPLINRATAEHGEMEQLLADLAAATGDGERELLQLRALQLVVLQHVFVEEGEIFPAFRQRATADQLAVLDEAAAKARAEAPNPPETRSGATSPSKGKAAKKAASKPRTKARKDAS